MLGLYTRKRRVMDYCWQRARSSAIRQMGWSLFSPPILSASTDPHHRDWCIPEDEEAHWILRHLDEAPAPLETYLSSRGDRRLGARFEALWRFFLDRHSHYRVLGANIQISDGSRTLGGLDFLIEDSHRNLVVHLELAVKFYLFEPDVRADSFEQWIGPNPDDSLGGKFSHLMRHQLPLSALPETTRTLRSRGLPLPDCRVAIIKGYLFAPLAGAPPLGAPINPLHLRGTWLSGADVDVLNDLMPGARWGILDKNQWLDPEPALPLSFGSLKSRLRNALHAAPDPLMVQAALDGRGRRFFIVPAAWRGQRARPDQA